MVFDLDKLAIQSYLDLTNDLEQHAPFRPADGGFAEWWKWADDGPGGHCPQWWKDPPDALVKRHGSPVVTWI